MEKNARTCILIIVGVVCVVLVVLLSISFSGVEYYQYGFPKRSSTGSVDTSKVYTAGKYAIGPDKTFKTFRAAAHVVMVDDIAIFTSDKLEVWLSCSFQYFLQPEHLALLHDTFDLQYQPILRGSGIDALKGAAPFYSTTDYIENRKMVEDALFEAIKKRLGGRCCKKGCEDSVEGCVPDCKRYDTCTIEDKGYFADVYYFQLAKVSITDDVISNNLLALTQLEDATKEGYLQEAQLVRKETEKQVNEIDNIAAEINQNATAMSELIIAKANAESRAVVENAHNMGLQLVYTELGLNSAQKASFNYLRMLRDKENVHLSVDFGSLRINTA
ncbi:uncharacterized protein LOC100378672 [Saccoglossus kowalevskii]|uniref:Uncharacterized protein LOC100378672 n=1 Tax=Saccoglossus kowalevskii TaxID=10224 RepID=A0ABM0GRU2_SACKO|nr:PREDICTED: uncharacterized protein LOC100378672 [Saccoglossus kowalevskii]